MPRAASLRDVCLREMSVNSGCIIKNPEQSFSKMKAFVGYKAN